MSYWQTYRKPWTSERPSPVPKSQSQYHCTLLLPKPHAPRSPPLRVVACTPVKSTSALPDDFWNIAGDEDANGTEEDEFGLGEAAEGGKTKSKPSGEEAMEEGAEGLPPAPAGDVIVKEEKQTEQLAESMEGVEPQEAPPTPVPAEVILRIVSCLEELKKCLEQAAHTIVSDMLFLHTLVD